MLSFSTRLPKAVASPWSLPDRAWKTSVPHLSLSATVPEEHAITFPTSTAFGWPRWRRPNSLLILPSPKRWKRASSGHGSDGAKSAWKICSKGLDVRPYSSKTKKLAFVSQLGNWHLPKYPQSPRLHQNMVLSFPLVFIFLATSKSFSPSQLPHSLGFDELNWFSQDTQILSKDFFSRLWLWVLPVLRI